MQRRWSFATSWIYGCCIAVVVLLVASAYLALSIATVEAERFATNMEKIQVQREFEHSIKEIAFLQTQLASWNDAIDQAAKPVPDAQFVHDVIDSWYFSDFGFAWTLFVGDNGAVKLAAHRGKPVGPAEFATVHAIVKPLINKALSRYDVARRELGSVQPNMREAMLEECYASLMVQDTLLIDGKISFVFVQAMVPKVTSFPAATTVPPVLISIKEVPEALLKSIESRLNIHNLAIGLGKPEKGINAIPIGKTFMSADVYVRWVSNTPTAFIWQKAQPSLLLLIAICVALLVFIAYSSARIVRDLQDSEARNKRLATHDNLTDLLNRGGFDDALQELIARPVTSAFAVFCIDLDFFKLVNDTHGHQAGDAVLKAVASRVVDRLEDRGIAARLGGDEFVLLLDHLKGKVDAIELANALVADCNLPVPFNGTTLQIGISIGVAFFPEHGPDPRTLLTFADNALYRAKSSGRNCVCLADGAVPKRSATKGARVSPEYSAA